MTPGDIDDNNDADGGDVISKQPCRCSNTQLYRKVTSVARQGQRMCDLSRLQADKVAFITNSSSRAINSELEELDLCHRTPATSNGGVSSGDKRSSTDATVPGPQPTPPATVDDNLAEAIQTKIGDIMIQSERTCKKVKQKITSKQLRSKFGESQILSPILPTASSLLTIDDLASSCSESEFAPNDTSDEEESFGDDSTTSSFYRDLDTKFPGRFPERGRRSHHNTEDAGVPQCSNDDDFRYVTSFVDSCRKSQYFLDNQTETAPFDDYEENLRLFDRRPDLARGLPSASYSMDCSVYQAAKLAKTPEAKTSRSRNLSASRGHSNRKTERKRFETRHAVDRCSRSFHENFERVRAETPLKRSKSASEYLKFG